MRSKATVVCSAPWSSRPGCTTYYYDIPSPDALRLDSVVRCHDRSSAASTPTPGPIFPRVTVAGTVPVTGGEGDWFGEWSTGNHHAGDRLVNPWPGSASPPR